MYVRMKGSVITCDFLSENLREVPSCPFRSDFWLPSIIRSHFPNSSASTSPLPVCVRRSVKGLIFRCFQSLHLTVGLLVCLLVYLRTVDIHGLEDLSQLARGAGLLINPA